MNATQSSRIEKNRKNYHNEEPFSAKRLKKMPASEDRNMSSPTTSPSNENEAGRRESSEILYESCEKGDVEVFEQTLSSDNTLVELRDSKDRTLLHIASINNHASVVSRLLSFQTEIDAIDGQGDTPMVIAATRGHLAVVKVLLEAGAKKNLQDKKGRTALMWACFYGHKEVVSLLIRFQADIEMQDDEGSSALLWASKKGCINIVTHLVAHKADISKRDKKGGTALLHACCYGYIPVVQYFVKTGADVEEKEFDGTNVLMHASMNGHKDMVQFLLKESWKSTKKSKKDQKKMEMVEFVIENGENTKVNTKNNDGRTALMLASLNGHSDVVLLLLQHRADIHLTDKLGNDALILACSFIFGNRKKTIVTLLEHGANVTNKNKSGDTAFKIATKKNFKELVGLLKLHSEKILQIDSKQESLSKLSQSKQNLKSKSPQYDKNSNHSPNTSIEDKFPRNSPPNFAEVPQDQCTLVTKQIAHQNKFESAEESLHLESLKNKARLQKKAEDALLSNNLDLFEKLLVLLQTFN